MRFLHLKQKLNYSIIFSVFPFPHGSFFLRESRLDSLKVH